MSLLPDGDHDAFVIDAAAHTVDGAGADATVDESGRSWVLELAIVSGPHKGEVVTVHASQLDGDEFDLMGMPATLTVTDGNPTVRIDR